MEKTVFHNHYLLRSSIPVTPASFICPCYLLRSFVSVTCFDHPPLLPTSVISPCYLLPSSTTVTYFGHGSLLPASVIGPRYLLRSSAPVTCFGHRPPITDLSHRPHLLRSSAPVTCFGHQPFLRRLHHPRVWDENCGWYSLVRSNLMKFCASVCS